MEQFELISRFSGQFHSLSIFLQKYGTYVTLAGLVFCLLNCFLGYRLRKLWNVIVGFLAGCAAGLALCIHFGISSGWALPAALAAGIVCAVLTYLLYRLGLFILCCGLTVFLLLQLLPSGSPGVLAACLLIGAIVGGLAIAKERVTVSLVTAIGGGYGSSALLLSLLGQTNSLLVILVTAVLAFLGILVQLKPWKSRRYWEQEDKSLKQERKDLSRSRAQKRKNRRRKKKREKKAKKQAKQKEQQKQTKKEPQRQVQREPSRTAQSPSRAPGTSPSASPSASSPSPKAAPAAPDTSPASGMPGQPSASETVRGDSYEDIRLQLSKEVSSIYAEQQSGPQTPSASNTPEDPDAPKAP